MPGLEKLKFNEVHTRNGACVALCVIKSNDDLLEFACRMIKLRKKHLDIVLAEE